MKVALVCMAKDEDHYIQEWVNYHLKLGFDNVFIYENNWRCSLENDRVIKIPIDGPARQVMAYNHFVQNLTEHFDWAAFFDVDEFLVLKQHSSIKDFIEDYKDYDGIGVNWHLFGSNGLASPGGEYSVLKRFTKRGRTVNQHIKTILKLRTDIFMAQHNPNIPIVDPNRNIIDGPFNLTGDDSIAQLNHYFCKSKEEFLAKVKRGKSDSTEFRDIGDFERHDFNEVEDLTALNFMTS
jgi:hypothetical protein